MRNNKGFTLLELIVVIIIVGVLATLGFSQYVTMIEKARGAEAKAVIGSIRSAGAAYWIENNDGAASGPVLRGSLVFTGDVLGIGTTGIPGATCASTNYFRYSLTAADNQGFTVTATRCTADGKTPNSNATNPGTVALEVNYADGTDQWSYTGGY